MDRSVNCFIHLKKKISTAAPIKSPPPTYLSPYSWNHRTKSFFTEYLLPQWVFMTLLLMTFCKGVLQRQTSVPVCTSDWPWAATEQELWNKTSCLIGVVGQKRVSLPGADSVNDRVTKMIESMFLPETSFF